MARNLHERKNVRRRKTEFAQDEKNAREKNMWNESKVRKEVIRKMSNYETSLNRIEEGLDPTGDS